SRIEGGVFSSSKGYAVTLPGGAWRVSEDGRADLELRHPADSAGMLVNAACEGQAPGRSFDILRRHLLAGLRHREILEEGEVAVGGRRAVHAIVDGQLADGAPRMRVEMYVVKDERCVYDFLYVAPPEAFEAWRPDFLRLVETLTTR
ncbi:MAG: hypothetical protein ACREJG_06050, partial [Candidatus Rokuibacteriota bacterium]